MFALFTPASAIKIICKDNSLVFFLFFMKIHIFKNKVIDFKHIPFDLGLLCPCLANST